MRWGDRIFSLRIFIANNAKIPPNKKQIIPAAAWKFYFKIYNYVFKIYSHPTKSLSSFNNGSFSDCPSYSTDQHPANYSSTRKHYFLKHIFKKKFFLRILGKCEKLDFLIFYFKDFVKIYQSLLSLFKISARSLIQSKGFLVLNFGEYIFLI